MRSFPRTARCRVVAASSVAALALGSAVPIAQAAQVDRAPVASDDLEDRQERVKNKVGDAERSLQESSKALSRAQARLDGAHQRLQGARADLDTARGKVQVAAEKDARMQGRLHQAEARLASAREKLAEGRRDTQEQRERVARRMVDSATGGPPELVAIAGWLEADGAMDLSHRQNAADVVMTKQTQVHDELHAAEVMLEVRRRDVEQMRDQVAVQRQAAAANLEEKQALEDRAEKARQQVRQLVGERADAKAERARLRARDQRTLRTLRAEEDKISEMLQRRAARALARQRAKERAQRAAQQDDGFLNWPTAGPISSPYGYRTHPIYGYYDLHDGVDFAPGCGSGIQAAASGNVVSSYWSDVYGRRLIVDHGAVDGVGLATVYNHASSYTVGVGAHVEQGQTIGYVGDSGWSTGCHLHFTVMANGKAVAPANWW